jgi:hypothetical protein
MPNACGRARGRSMRTLLEGRCEAHYHYGEGPLPPTCGCVCMYVCVCLWGYDSILACVVFIFLSNLMCIFVNLGAVELSMHLCVYAKERGSVCVRKQL